MMEKSNRDFYKTLGMLSMVAFVSSALVYVSQPSTASEHQAPKHVTGHEEDFQKNVRMMIDHHANTCSFEDSDYFSRVITVTYPEKIDEVSGRWVASTSNIQLMQPGGLDVGTAAHEVAHAVDTLLEDNSRVHWHYEAYLQGVLTQCVYNILQQDIRDAQEPFRFAN